MSQSVQVNQVTCWREVVQVGLRLLLVLTVFTATAVVPVASQGMDDGIFVYSLAWSADGSTVVLGTGNLPVPSEDNIRGGCRIGDTGVYLLDSRQQDVMFTRHTTCAVTRAELDSGQRFLRTFEGAFLIVWDLQTGEPSDPIQLQPFDGIVLNAAIWHPHDGRLMTTGLYSVLVHGSDDLFTPAIAYMSRHSAFLEDSPPIEGFLIQSVWSPDEMRAATSTATGTIFVWNMNTLMGVIEVFFTEHDTVVDNMVWNAATGLIASGDQNGDIWVWNPETGEPLAALVGHTDAILDLDWRADGRQLVSTSLDNTMRVWNWPSGEMEIVEASRLITAVAYSQDGTQLAYGGEVIDVDAPEIMIIAAP